MAAHYNWKSVLVLLYAQSIVPLYFMHSFIPSAQVLNAFKYSDLGFKSRIAVIDALRLQQWLIQLYIVRVVGASSPHTLFSLLQISPALIPIFYWSKKSKIENFIWKIFWSFKKCLLL